MIRSFFSGEFPATYEWVNHVLTLGLDRQWRRQAARMAAAAGGTEWADLCTGTGEMAVCLSRLAAPGTRIHAVDFSPGMMAVARKKPEASDMVFAVSDVYALPFPDDCLDLITLAFAARNLNRDRNSLIRAFSGFYRVLKPGGRFINLETSQPASRWIRWLFHGYVRLFVRPVGALISGKGEGYAYLEQSMVGFYPPAEMSGILREAGFRNVTCRKLMPGIVAVHQGWKS